MTDLQQIGFNYGVMPLNDAMELKASAERIKVRLKRTADDIIEIGKELIAAKEKCGHGNFEIWLQAEFDMTDRSARRFIQVAETFGDKTDTVSVLNATALYALSAPSTNEEVRTEVLQRIENGENVTTTEIEKLKKQLKEVNAENEQLTEKYQSSRKSVERAQMAADNAEQSYKELENRFDHYVKQGIEEKTPELQKQIEAQLSADFQAKIDHQTDEISRLKNQLANSNTTAAEKAKINDELSVLQEKLALSTNQLDTINQQIAQKRAAIQTDEQINQSYFDCAEQLITGISASLAIMDVFIDFDDQAQQTVWHPLCVIDEKTKRKLSKAIEHLQSAASSIQHMIEAEPV